MARVLVLELDPVFAAVIEDRLLVAGHESQLVSDPALAVSVATEGRADLLVMELDLPAVSGVEIVRQLRRQPETRSLPILALSASDQSADRIEALRAGVDDFLSRPFDPEELMLRLDRMLGRRGVAAPPLSGDLATHPIWGLLQYIQQADKSGDLRVHGKSGAGRVQLQRGRVVAAQWQTGAKGAQSGQLRGRDALLAVVDMKEGRFQLAAEADGGEAPADGIRIPDVLIEAAWIQDQLGRRQQHMPPTGVPLEPVAEVLPPVDDNLGAMPIPEVFHKIRAKSGLRLYDLMSQGFAAPSKVRLAVACLVELGAIKATDQASPSSTSMSTTEISSSVVFDVAVHNLLSNARNAGFDVTALPYLLLAEPGVWPELQKLPASVPGFLRHDALRKLVERTQDQRGGSATFPTDFGKLSLHVQPLTGAVRQQVEAIVPACAGVLLWLDQVEERELIRRVVDRLEAASGAAAGVLVAPTPAAAEAAAELTSGKSKWQTSSHAPQSLLGVLRLLQPRTA